MHLESTVLYMMYGGQLVSRRTNKTVEGETERGRCHLGAGGTAQYAEVFVSSRPGAIRSRGVTPMLLSSLPLLLDSRRCLGLQSRGCPGHHFATRAVSYTMRDESLRFCSVYTSSHALRQSDQNARASPKPHALHAVPIFRATD